ncbi:MAG TPA: cyanophycinase [Pirellulales bacterium]|jgi:cyanophycinase|nr:cyanophycinase [Pirellulales bacterium]
MSRLADYAKRVWSAQVRLATLVKLTMGVGVVTLAWLYATNLKIESQHLAPGQEPGGTLIICGGGEVPRDIENRFVRLAGGRAAKLVIIPTAHYEADKIDPRDPHIVEVTHDWHALGVESVTFLHTRDRSVADDEEFVEPLTEATGVWIEGGDQEWLTAPYADTLVEAELKELLARGGVVGGNSAGAACMTRVMIAAGRRPREGEGFDLLPGAVIDQHFLTRNRLKRLIGFLSDHQELIGFGIDERTALVVRVSDMRLSVIGESYVLACVPEGPDRAARFEVLQRGDTTDMVLLRESDSPIASVVDVEEILTSEGLN